MKAIFISFKVLIRLATVAWHNLLNNSSGQAEIQSNFQWLLKPMPS